MIAVVAMLLVLIGAGLLRTPPRRGPVIAGAAALLFGLLMTSVALKGVMHALSLYPAHDFAKVVRHVLDEDDGRPVILFVGTSMSRQGLDDGAMTEALNAAGWDVRVASLSLQGSSQQERDMHLRQYLRAAPRPPLAVFIEITPPTDGEPAYVFKVAKFSGRAIGQFGPRATAWSLRGLLEDQDAGLVSWAKDMGGLGLHAGLNLLNVGALREARHVRDVAPMAAFEPFDTPRIAPPSTSEIIDGLSGEAEPSAPTYPWVIDYRESQARMLAARGTGFTGFYAPPSLEPELRAYGGQACAAQTGRTCLDALDPTLRAALMADHWNDRDHLLASGAAIYSDWLAQALLGLRDQIEGRP